MAAYAAVTSLMGTMHLSSLDLQEGNKEHLESLYDKVGSLLEFLDNSDNELMKDLQKKVKDLANEVEDEVESQALLIMEKDEHIQTEANERLLIILQQAIPDIDYVKEELSKQRKNNKLQAGNGSVGGTCSPQSDVSTIDNNVVGYNIEQEVTLRQLTGDSFQMEVISIVGMGGIGKSTFAKRMFSDPSVVNFFDVREWITVSKDYSLRNMLLSLLQDTTGVKEEINPLDQGNDEVEIDNAELADRLQKSFKGKRYLIAVDDIWSREVWDEIRLWFPENNNTSRILLTTRIMEVARYASYPKNPFPMRPLEPKESWDLFCQKAFGEKDCPTKFRTSRKVIVENCKGLPLILSVVAGTLSSKRTLDEWNLVAQGVSSLVNVDDYQHCSRVLALSYNYLPSHLKACFLYFGVFPKDSEISVKKLIRLWIAEGLFELRGRLRDLEEVADSLLHDLIDKSLVMVSKRSLDGKIKTCKIHDLLHDLCLIESESENLLYVSNSKTVVPQDHRWVSVHSDRGFISPFGTYNKTRSVHVPYGILEFNILKLGLDHFKLLRVLNLARVKLISFPSELSNLVSLRYFSMMVYGRIEYLPIYKLLNLQTFIFLLDSKYSITVQLPNGIWKMSQLRHLHCRSIYFLNSPPNKYRVLENLQSVSGLNPSCCTKEIFEGIKKVKQLGICNFELNFSSDHPNCLDNLRYLHELEALSIVSYSLRRGLPCPASFPPNLKKLTPCKTFLLWEDMAIISKLPKLEVLQLKAQAFECNDCNGETVWEVTDMGFPVLKFFLLEWLDLEYWRATDDYFPCLERIIIRNCHKLKEIPQVLADSVTLQLIELRGCSSSLVTFATKIQENHEDLGNNILKVDAFDTIRGSVKCVGNEDTFERVVCQLLQRKQKLCPYIYDKRTVIRQDMTQFQLIEDMTLNRRMWRS